MYTKSKITGKTYDTDKVWYIWNIDQVAKYNYAGAEEQVLDILYNSEKHKFIWVYPRNAFMADLYDKFCKYELPAPSGNKK